MRGVEYVPLGRTRDAYCRIRNTQMHLILSLKCWWSLVEFGRVLNTTTHHYTPLNPAKFQGKSGGEYVRRAILLLDPLFR